MYRLQQSVPHNYQTNNNLKGGFCYTERMKDIAICACFETLKHHADELLITSSRKLQIIDNNLKILWKS